MVALLDTQCGLSMAETSDNLARQHGITREADGRLRAAQPEGGARPRPRGASSGRRSFPSTSTQGRKTRAGRGGRSPAARTRPSRAWRRSGRPSGRTASSPPATRAGSWTARRPSSWPRARRRERRGQRPLARIVSWATAGVPPEIMGIGPVPATRKALEARRPHACATSTSSRSTRPSPASTSPSRRSSASTARRPTSTAARSRSAIRSGATGTRLLLTLALELRRRKGRYGLATACIGGGQGIARDASSRSKRVGRASMDDQDRRRRRLRPDGLGHRAGLRGGGLPRSVREVSTTTS